MIRTFVAVDLPPGVQEQLAGFMEKLKGSKAQVTWVKADRIHLTLKFLGNVSEDLIPAVSQALDRAGEAMEPFTVTAGGCGAFPSIKNMRVVWVGIESGFERLQWLQRQVEDVLSGLGFETEARPFKAHLTLGRVKGRTRLERLQEALVAQKGFRTEAFDVSEIVLYKSDLRPEGPRYTPLHRSPLQGRPT
ncbi:RNA 2',3'-cyclic phosphodiesterase [Desulfoglaeba alkanexedens]|jgi:2'-5' RNA ligase|uniref:RNA 2',3'-cyclic phosphodiesterase n=1 Tax=Desulfoglaeba alkanexedens ALDC TaxID=980445 RepID=A0A4P8L2C5_9BACT|nr:RNA 2',3'-cyclic phosphodiesterase [Desulfoglaeba alkanexedens]QCQ21793.1 RNA 2',3'-cyclic phosphodiesterase [Desulfoglaeba alkanexedens ALDC]